jgi:hypothetical protein
MAALTQRAQSTRLVMRRKSPVPRASHASHEAREPGEAPAWLRDKVYLPKRQRTVDLVTASVDTLTKEGRPVSLAAVARKSKQLDATGTGISESAILGNAAARAYYERYRTWRGAGGRRERREQREPWGPGGRQGAKRTPSAGEPEGPAAPPGTSAAPRAPRVLRVEPARDVTRARQRYLRMSKPVLVERLLAAEHAAAAHEERWLRLNDDFLLWILLVEHLVTQNS